MQLGLPQLDAHLRKGRLAAVYTLHGDEPLLLQEAADAVRAAARAQGFAERNVFSASGARFDWSGVLAALGSQSLFAKRRIVELAIASGKPGKDGSDALQRLVRMLPDDASTLCLVLLPRLDKATRASGWFGALDGAGVSVSIEPVERNVLPAWIAERLARQGQRVESGEAGQRALNFFADRVEGNLLAAHQEVQKLALLYPKGELGFEQIERAVADVARFDVFELSEAVLSGRAARAQRMLDRLQAEGVAAVLAHHALAEEIRALKRIGDALATGRPLPLALRENRVWGRRERLFERVLPRLDEARLAQLLLAAHRADGIVKGLKVPGWPADGWHALRRLALLLCSACAAPRPARSAASIARKMTA